MDNLENVGQKWTITEEHHLLDEISRDIPVEK